MGEIIYGVEERNILPNKPIGCIIFDILKESKSDRICMVDLFSNEKITCEMLLKHSLKIFQYLKKLEEIEPITKLCIISENNWKFPLCMISALYMAKPVHLINPDQTLGELRHLFSISEPSVVFCSPSQVAKITQLNKEAKFIKHILIIDEKLEKICETPHEGNIVHLNTILWKKSSPNEELTPEIVDMEETILILNTSGTTGMPKCAMHSHRSLKAMTALLMDERFYGFKIGDGAIVFMPLYHLYGILLILVTTCTRGTTLIMRKFDREIYLKAVEEYSVPILYVVPTVLNNFLKNSTENYHRILQGRNVISAAAPMTKEFIYLAKERLQVSVGQCYGMTEIGVILYQLRSNFSLAVGSSGTAGPGVQIKVVDPNTNKILPRNSIGEFCFKGPTLMNGYLNDEANTKKIMDSDGFIHTGDIGYCDDDDNAFVVDRLKDVIKFKGFLVSPTEIESTLLQHPFVRDAAVTSIPDDHAGELSVGLVVKKEDCTLTKEELIKFVEENISYYKRLHGGVKFVKQIPKNPTGKILRRDLQHLL